jgi:broad specificity phosphatase PhoE
MSPRQVSDPTNGMPGYGLSEHGKLEAARAGEQLADDFYGNSAVEVISSDFCRSG